MVGIAIIGAGGWGQNHVRVFSFLRAEGLVSEVMVVDIVEERAKKMAKRFGVKWSTSYRDVLNNDDIHGVVISTPTKLHYQHALEALKAGKHTLIEKPMTETVEQAIELTELAKERNLILMVGFLLRYSSAINFAKEYYEEGKIGRVLTVLAKRTSYWPNRPMDVGVIRDLAIHDIDLIRYMLGKEPLYVLARGGALKHDYEDYASLFIEYGGLGDNNLMHALIEVNWVTPFKIRRMEITGEKGVIIIDLLQHAVRVLKEDGIYQPNINAVEPLYLEDKNFVRAILGEEKPLVTGEDGVIALKVCEKALKSIATNEMVKIS